MSEDNSKTAMSVGNKGLALCDLDQMWRFARMIAASGLAPKGFEKPETIIVGLQMAMELGLSPMQGLQNIGVINGRPGIYGDAALALVRASGLCDDYKQTLEGEGDHRKAIVISKRKGGTEIRSEFSVKDAKIAGLWGKTGPWTQYPDRMLTFRARGFNLRDNFSDVLKGFKTFEEVADYPSTCEPDRFAAAKPIFAAGAPASDDFLSGVGDPAETQAQETTTAK